MTKRMTSEGASRASLKDQRDIKMIQLQISHTNVDVDRFCCNRKNLFCSINQLYGLPKLLDIDVYLSNLVVVDCYSVVLTRKFSI